MKVTMLNLYAKLNECQVGIIMEVLLRILNLLIWCTINLTTESS